jgi:hypothetical protein
MVDKSELIATWVKEPLSNRGKDFALEFKRVGEAVRVFEGPNVTLLLSAVILLTVVVGTAVVLRSDLWNYWIPTILIASLAIWAFRILALALTGKKLEACSQYVRLERGGLCCRRVQEVSGDNAYLVVHRVHLRGFYRGTWSGFAVVVVVGAAKMTLALLEDSEEVHDYVGRLTQEIPLRVEQGNVLRAPMNRVL